MTSPTGSTLAADGALPMLAECLASAGHNVRARALRSGLTMLGVVIGVSSIICTVALVQGLSRSIAAQFSSLGGDTLTVRADTPFEQQLAGVQNRLRLRDLEQLAYHVDGIRNITPLVSMGRPGASDVRNGSRTRLSQLLGTTASYLEVHQGGVRHGRFLSPTDDAARRRVAVIGPQLQRELGLDANPVGQYILVGGEWFKVVGLMEARGELFGISQDNYLLMPFQTAIAMNGSEVNPDLWISFSAADVDSIEATKGRVASFIRKLHAIKPGQRDDFVVESADSLARSFRDISVLVTLVVSGIVGISLIVSGVGIMNIMLVSVTERTREIGIAKALGAPSRYILLQFLFEATLMAGTGGVIGILCGYGAALGFSQLLPNFPAPDLPWMAAAGAFLFSVATGIGFGILPASQASRLAPIDALRHE
jgi:putative ABC transport system permease protein